VGIRLTLMLALATTWVPKVNAQCYKFSSGSAASVTLNLTHLPPPTLASTGIYQYTSSSGLVGTASVTVGQTTYTPSSAIPISIIVTVSSGVVTNFSVIDVTVGFESTANTIVAASVSTGLTGNLFPNGVLPANLTTSSLENPVMAIDISSTQTTYTPTSIGSCSAGSSPPPPPALPPTSAPVIGSIAPGSPTASNSSQTLQVLGSGFEAGFAVNLILPNNGGSAGVNSTQIHSVTSTSFQLVVTLVLPGTYGIRVTNPDGGQSNTFSVAVMPGSSPPAQHSQPTITGVTPTTIVASSSSQGITALGNNFQNGLTVTLSLPNGKGPSQLSASQVVVFNSTAVGISAVFSEGGTVGLQVTNPDGGQSSVFNLNVTPGTRAPTIDVGRGALNSASFTPGVVTPGSLMSIFGKNFASTSAVANTIPLPLSLGGVTVTLNGIRAAISGIYHDPVNGDQINAQAPWELANALPAIAEVVVTRDGTTSNSQIVAIANASPGVFAITLNRGAVVGSGVGQAIAYSNADGALAAPVGSVNGLASHPAKVGDPSTLVILTTGLGSVDAAVADGDVPQASISKTIRTPTVTIGDVPAQVVFSGLVGRDSNGKPLGYVGVYQINVIVSPGTPVGDAVQLKVSLDGVTTTAAVSVAIGS